MALVSFSTVEKKIFQLSFYHLREFLFISTGNNFHSFENPSISKGNIDCTASRYWFFPTTLGTKVIKLISNANMGHKVIKYWSKINWNWCGNEMNRKATELDIKSLHECSCVNTVVVVKPTEKKTNNNSSICRKNLFSENFPPTQWF